MGVASSSLVPFSPHVSEVCIKQSKQSVTVSYASGPVVILRRKQVGNPDDYFNKNFAEYEEGFESKGKFHTGLIHILLIVSMDLYNSSVHRQNYHCALSKL